MIKWLLSKLPRQKKSTRKIDAPIDNLIPSPIDKRDYTASVGTVPIPSTYEILRRPPIRNQRNLGSCASFAIVRAWEISELSKGNNPYEGSEMFHFYEGRKMQGVFPQNSGMTMRNACHTFLQFGMASEFFFPYSTTQFNRDPGWLNYTLASQVKPLRYERITKIDDLKRSIVQGVPVVFGAWTDNSFQLLRGSGSIWRPRQRGNYGHALVAVGFNSTGVIVDNSYGTAWGDKGTCVIPYNIFQQYSFDWFRIVT